MCSGGLHCRLHAIAFVVAIWLSVPHDAVAQPPQSMPVTSELKPKQKLRRLRAFRPEPAKPSEVLDSECSALERRIRADVKSLHDVSCQLLGAPMTWRSDWQKGCECRLLRSRGNGGYCPYDCSGVGVPICVESPAKELGLASVEANQPLPVPTDSTSVYSEAMQCTYWKEDRPKSQVPTFSLYRGPANEYCEETIDSKEGNWGHRWQGAAEGHGDDKHGLTECEARCSRTPNCHYFSLWLTGGLLWCRLSETCNKLTWQDHSIKIYRKEVSEPTVQELIATSAGKLRALDIMKNAEDLSEKSTAKHLVPGGTSVQGLYAVKKVSVVCIGDSITYGIGASSPNASYPAQLQKLLGDKYTVYNLGVAHATMQRAGDRPYWSDPFWPVVMQNPPDIAIIMLGTNDAKTKKEGGKPNWENDGHTGLSPYEKDYLAMIESIRKLPSHPAIYTVIPPPLYSHLFGGGVDMHVVNDVLPVLVPDINTNAGLTHPPINAFSALGGEALLHPNWLPDGIHPNDVGYKELALTIFKGLGLGDPQVTQPL